MLMYNNYVPVMAVRKTAYNSKDDLKLGTQSLLGLESKKLPAINKRIGKLTQEERQRKIERYRAKRNLRVWEKRISYNCRKKVADKRLRIKGRFVSKEEANRLSERQKHNPKEQESSQMIEKHKLCEDNNGNQSVKKVFNVIPYDKSSNKP